MTYRRRIHELSISLVTLWWFGAQWMLPLTLIFYHLPYLLLLPLQIVILYVVVVIIVKEGVKFMNVGRLHLERAVVLQRREVSCCSILILGVSRGWHCYFG